MSKALLFVAGISAGCLLTLMFNIPLFPPLEDNAATVLAALSSTALAVVGAFWLWSHQAAKRQRDIKGVVVPIFHHFYLALLQVRALIDLSSARNLYAAIQVDERARGESEVSPDATEQKVLEFRDKTFYSAIDAAIVDGGTVLQQWDSMQDVLLAINPESLPYLIELHRLTKASVVQLPLLASSSKPTSLDQVGPQVGTSDRLKIDWALSRIASNLNHLDGGHRPTEGAERTTHGRAIVIETLLASKPLGPVSRD